MFAVIFTVTYVYQRLMRVEAVEFLMNPERRAIHPLVKRIPGAAVTILLVVWAIVQVYPILFMFITSVKTDKQILNAPFALPEPLNSKTTPSSGRAIASPSPFPPSSLTALPSRWAA